MSCEELLAMLNDYVDGGVDPGVCAEFAEHLAGCNPCQVVVDNIRGTITLFRDGQPYPIPTRLQDRLRAAVRLRWAEGKDSPLAN
jgi:anti-sigma factor RsiW